jgi:hypothetical protein
VLSGITYVANLHAAPIAAVPSHHVAVSTAAQVLPPPVEFVNPFDPGEVFEFPPGTSAGEAHDAVAQLLLDRARQRVTEAKSPGLHDSSKAAFSGP